MSTTRTLSYRNDLSELSRMAEELCDYCREYGVDPDTTLALTLCMNELFANTVKYGYGSVGACADRGDRAAAKDGALGNGRAEGHSGGAASCYPVEIQLEYFADRLEARYSDSARAFNPFTQGAAQLPDVDVPAEELPTGGFGLHLLRRMSTSRSYVREGGRNCVLLTFEWR